MHGKSPNPRATVHNTELCLMSAGTFRRRPCGLAWIIATGCYIFAPLEYENVNRTVLMYCIHLAAGCPLDGEMLLKQQNESAVNRLGPQLIHHNNCTRIQFVSCAHLMAC